MCGITGFIDLSKRTSSEVLLSMRDSLMHRGPDAGGEYFFDSQPFSLGLAHRRLSIIDTTDGANQPMHYEELSMVFNGELYNYQEIREILVKAGYSFRTQSDSEVVLLAFHKWKSKALDLFKGMFSLILFNREEQTLYLIRDRFGVKPLYYYLDHQLLLFGSELKPFHTHPQFKKSLDLKSVWYFFQYGNIPSPHAIFKDTYKVEPGTMLRIDCKTLRLEKKVFWSPTAYFQKETLSISFDDAKTKTRELLTEAIDLRMVSDVPVGLFLSGGYDSATTAALLTQSHKALKTFTVAVPEAGLNEGPKAKKIAEFLGTDHMEITCDLSEALQVIPKLSTLYDEPFADSSAIPTYLVAAHAATKVKVALSADGGDEMFAGYNRHLYFHRIPKAINYLPPILGSSVANTISALGFQGLKAQRVQKFARLMSDFSIESYMNAMTTSMSQDVLSTFFKHRGMPDPLPFIQGRSPLASMLLNDSVNYLPNDILHKVDRATMAVGLEGREPFLDHDLFEFLAQVPDHYKCDGTRTKILLKEIAHDMLPTSLMEGPKMGFAIPISAWMRKYLSEELLALSEESFLKEQGVFNPIELRQAVLMFLKGKDQNALFIWYYFSFQSWYKQWM
jgi:asparagine synthase (glutamine-hydrolysing)